MADRLVIVSNWVPRSVDGAGADAALAPSLAAGGDDRVLWFGWSGRLSEDPAPRIMPARGLDRAVNFIGIDLSESQYDGYLNGFANGTLWPLFHDMPERARFHGDDLVFYRSVNAHFAAALTPFLRADDRIWIHDYHLIPLAWLLRRAGVRNPIGLFLHLPFPTPAGLLAWPWHARLASDLAAYDLVGFQTHRDEQNFAAFMRAGTRATPATGVFPAGLSTRRHMQAAASPDTAGRAERLGRALSERPLIISADRLDYTKGLLERLQAYERLLDETHVYRGASSFVQVTAPSRPLVPGYVELRMEQQALVERINARHLTRGWMPVLDIYARLPRSSLAALYRLGRVGFAAPLCDGVNLAAKEYVASQDPRDPGALILSRAAGAAELLTEAILVDPTDVPSMTRALRTALSMPLDERQDCWRRMIAKLLHHDAAWWHRSYVAALEHAHRAAAARRGIDRAAAETGPRHRPASSRAGRAIPSRLPNYVRPTPARALRPDVA